MFLPPHGGELTPGGFRNCRRICGEAFCSRHQATHRAQVAGADVRSFSSGERVLKYSGSPDRINSMLPLELRPKSVL